MKNLNFKRLRGTNVCSYPHFDIPLDNQGTVLLQGDNGSGKSTPWYALAKLFYGKSPKKLTHATMINVHDPKDYWLRVDLEVDGVPYAVEEWREHTKPKPAWHEKKNGLLIYRNGQDITPKDVKNVRALLPSLIGYSNQNFLSTIYLPQEHNHVLIEGTPAVKRQHVMWIFGLKKFEDWSLQAKKEKDRLKGKLNDTVHLEEEYKGICEELTALGSLKSLVTRYKHVGRLKTQLTSKLTVLENVLERDLVLRTQIERREKITERIRALGMVDIMSSEELHTLEKEIDRLREDVTLFKQQAQTLIGAHRIQKELDQYDAMPPLSQLRSDLEKTQKNKILLQNIELPEAIKADKTRDELDAIDEISETAFLIDKVHSLDMQRKALEEKLSHLLQHIKRGVCPVCKRPWELSDEELEKLKTERDTTRATLDNVNKHYHSYHLRMKAAQRRDELKAQLEKLPSSDPDEIECVIERLISEEKKLVTDISVAENKIKLEAQIRALPPFTLEELRKKLTVSKTALVTKKDLYDRTAEAVRLLEQIAELPAGDLEIIDRSIRETKEATTTNRKRLEKITARLYALQNQRARYSEMKERQDRLKLRIDQTLKAREDCRIWGTLQEGFQFVLKKQEHVLLEKVTQRLPSYLLPLFGKQSQWLRADLCKDSAGIDMRLTSVGKQLPMEGPSPGMRAKLGLASIFAFRDIYEQAHCNLLILDEPLQKMDSTCRPGFMEILSTLVKKKIGTIIVTAHDAEIKGAEFDKRWHAMITRGISSLEFNEL